MLDFQVAVDCVRKIMMMLAASYNVKRFVWAGDFNADIHGTDSDLIGPFITMRFGHDASKDQD